MDRVRAAVDRAVKRYKRKKKEKKVDKMWKEHMADQERVAQGTGILVLGRYPTKQELEVYYESLKHRRHPTEAELYDLDTMPIPEGYEGYDIPPATAGPSNRHDVSRSQRHRQESWAQKLGLKKGSVKSDRDDLKAWSAHDIKRERARQAKMNRKIKKYNEEKEKYYAENPRSNPALHPDAVDLYD